MVCTYCGKETGVTNSRHQRRSNTVWRRRKCLTCGAIFSTQERADYERTWVVQSPSGALHPFLRDKLFISIHKSVAHRPTALRDAIGLTDTVINAVAYQAKDGLIKVEDIAKESYRVLKRFDQPAAISYRAFHADVL